jgi:hypothetical protein
VVFLGLGGLVEALRGRPGATAPAA